MSSAIPDPELPEAPLSRPGSAHRSARARGFPPFAGAPIPRVSRRPRSAWRETARWTLCVVATAVIIGALSIDAVLIYMLPDRRTDAGAAGAAIAGLTALGAGFLALLFVFVRAYAKVVVALLSLVLLTAGLGLFCAAPVVRQMDVPHLAEDRAFVAFVWCGAAATALGVGLGLFAIRWSMEKPARRWLARSARLLGSAYGVILALGGIGLILAFLALINGSATFDEGGNEITVVEQAIALTAIAMWLLAPGLILTYHGISSSMREGSSEFRPPVAWIAVVAFGAVIVAGHLNMTRESPVALPMPMLHVLAAALPGIAYVAMAGRGHALRGLPVRWITWRQATLAAAVSMSVATIIAIYVESFGSIYALVLLLVHNGIFADAANAGDAFDIIGDADFILTRNEQFFAGMITAAVLAPLAEEFAKGLSVRVLLRPMTSRAQAFLLGACAGAGFGFLEALLYGLAAIGTEGEGGLAGWWLIMFVRGGSTSLHVLCSGLAGLAFWHWSRGYRRQLALALFSTAVLIHAAWNGAFTAIDSRILGLDTLQDRTIEIVAYAIVAAVSAAMIVAIPFVARSLRDLREPVEATPIASMSPWLG